MNRLTVCMVIVSTIGCTVVSGTPTAQSGSAPKDGELAFLSDYRSYPPFLTNIQKPKAVRDIYINEQGAHIHQGQSFPFGTVLVMEIYDVQTDANGTPVKNHDGTLIKADLKKIYVMQKGKGWGNHVSPELRNGNWVYAAFQPNGERLEVDYAQCRGCHKPLGEARDYVHRYDEYFAKRMHRH